MITPQTNPSAFRIQQVGAFQYYVPLIHPIEIDEDIEDAVLRYWRDEYKKARPDELKDGKIADASYFLWARSEESNTAALRRGEKKTKAGILFTPKDGAPPIADLWGTDLTSAIYESVISFTLPTLPNKNDGQATSAVNTANSPDFVTV